MRGSVLAVFGKRFRLDRGDVDPEVPTAPCVLLLVLLLLDILGVVLLWFPWLR
jgi:hypothetical protein